MTLKEAIVYLLDEFHLSDQVYTVRSRAVDSGTPFDGDSWNHPAVLKFCEACQVLEEAKSTL